MKFISQKLKLKTNLKFNIKLSNILNLPLNDSEKLLDELKKNKYFKILKAAGVIKSVNFKKDFSKYPFEKFVLKDNSQTNYSFLLDTKNPVVSKIISIGIDKFKKFFLDHNFDNNTIANKCKLTIRDIEEIKKLIQKLYITEQFNQTSYNPDIKIYSCIGKIEKLKNNLEIIFFNENLWREKYEIDREKFKVLCFKLKKKEKEKFIEIIEKLSSIEYQKSTLYKLVNLLIEKQKKYLISGNVNLIEKLTQKELASICGCHPSVINRLVNYKSIILPWGIEIPLTNLLASQKDINKLKLSEFININPKLSDREIAQKFFEIYKVKISRRSINQYRKEIYKN